jgi:hypothetical protein
MVCAVSDSHVLGGLDELGLSIKPIKLAIILQLLDDQASQSLPRTFYELLTVEFSKSNKIVHSTLVYG